MSITTKLMTIDGDQAVCLPKEFWFQGTEVFIRRDDKTGDVILSSKPSSWQEFFELVDSIYVPDDFMADREYHPAKDRELF